MGNGSKRWFNYADDNNRNFAVQLDESIYETAALGFGPVQLDAIPMAVKSSIPLEMRYITCSRVDNNVTLRASFYVGTLGTMGALAAAGTVTVDGVAWNISKMFGEVCVIVPPTDTAQLDGDVDQNIVAGP